VLSTVSDGNRPLTTEEATDVNTPVGPILYVVIPCTGFGANHGKLLCRDGVVGRPIRTVVVRLSLVDGYRSTRFVPALVRGQS
jgi:hypothetical protein